MGRLVSCLVSVGAMFSATLFGFAKPVVSKPESRASVLQTCSGLGRTLTPDELQKLLADPAFSDVQVRRDFVTLLRQSENRCRKSLEVWLEDMTKKPSDDFKTKTGRLVAMTLGVLLEFNSAKRFVEFEMAAGGGLEWLATLEQWDEKTHAELLKFWVMRSGERLRKMRHLEKMSPELYGKSQIEASEKSPDGRMISPIVVGLFLKNLAKRAPQEDEFSALNIIYANMSAGAREIYLKAYRPVLRKNAVAWISAFRLEPAWSQFQLLELMGQTGGSEMVRELMWLSQNHVDLRMKNRASQALDQALNVR